ncbi:MAG: Fe-S cluster assembly protein SufD [Rhodothermales bacterium]|nr:Fe-S cluster assembly protein SufD [Rhodothermales bacterium]MBO6781245.1 Fe-S cluster assembly protein SufD [Rhodothermales bacterium]
MADNTSIEARLVEVWEERSGVTMNGRLQDGRSKAIERFRTQGIPAARSEAWKYTPIRKVLESLPPLEVGAGSSADAVTADAVRALDISGLDGFRAVLVDGRFRADLSDLDGLPRGVRVLDLGESASDPVVLEHLDQSGTASRDAFTELNSAFVQDGLFVHLAKGVVMERPLVILQVISGAKPSLVQPRVLGVFERGSQARLVEVCRGLGSERVLINAVSEYFTATDALIDHVRLIDEPAETVHVNSLRSYQEEKSNFSTNVITLSEGLVRNQAYFLPDGEYCETHLSGFYLAQNGAHVDNHTLVDHAKPECYSNELFKGILASNSVGVFNGKVLVRQDAQKTNAYQSNKSVLLDESARTYSKPELEIYADDVKCSHGATTGELDQDAMFYLRTRGIRPEQARLILLEAFASDVLDRIALDPVREHIDQLVRTRLSRN